MKNSLYSNPLYYEIAFSFIEPQKQVDLFEEFISQYSKIRAFEEKSIVKLILPQEFLEIVKRTDKFEFLGWFKRDSTEQLEKANRDNNAILRRI